VPGPAAFDELVGRLDYPMFVVTTAAGEERSGCLVGFSTQCSINPARYLLCLSDKNHTFRLAQRATHLAAHVLGADQVGLAKLFGEETGDEIDKFTRCAWSPGPGGVPLLSEAVGWFGGPIRTQLELGDHHGFVIDVEAAQDSGGTRYLRFQDLKDLDPGHEA
jgi:flavin reductase (DIM6/NTAB) family NADH-FMN oxidoreductase RutF